MHLDVTMWLCQHPLRMIWYLPVDCAGKSSIAPDSHEHTHRPRLAREVARKSFTSYFDYRASNWQVKDRCRQVCYTNGTCDRIHFRALDCQRKRTRPRIDQSCCGIREWVLEMANEKCEHPECVVKKTTDRWWSEDRSSEDRSSFVTSVL